MIEEAAVLLRTKAEHYRHLATEVGDERANIALLQLADEYEARANIVTPVERCAILKMRDVLLDQRDTDAVRH